MTSRPKTSAALSPDCAALPGEPAAEWLPGNAPSPADGLHHLAGDGAQTPGSGDEREPSPLPGQPAQVHRNQFCTCSHGIAVHDIRGNGTRGVCCVISGRQGVRCACKNYETAS